MGNINLRKQTSKLLHNINLRKQSSKFSHNINLTKTSSEKSHNIPFDIQMEIIKKVSDVKSLIRFKSVSKPWKSFIDNSEFIKSYGACHTHPHSYMLMYKARNVANGVKFIRLVEDDKNETFKVQRQEFAPFVLSPLLNQHHVLTFVGACHGLVCLYNYTSSMVVVWNPSIRKSYGIALPIDYSFVFGFGVCPVARDPTVVKLNYETGMPWHVEVFTLSSGVWDVIPSSNLPQSIKIMSSQVVTDTFIYWAAYDDSVTPYKYIVVSFDLITKEFEVIDLPNSLTEELYLRFSVCKLRESLVVYGSEVEGAGGCDVWVMEHDSSFQKLFTIDAHVIKILGFTESGEPICQIRKADGQFTTLDVYDPCSQRIKNLGISVGAGDSFFMGSYKESLLLLNHLDSHVYYDNN